MTIKRITICLVAVGLVGTLPAAAQSLTGTIQGTVVDQQGGALPGVTVSAFGKGAPRCLTPARPGCKGRIGPRPGNHRVFGAVFVIGSMVRRIIVSERGALESSSRASRPRTRIVMRLAPVAG